MKPNYKNWVPKGLIYGLLAGGLVSAMILACVAMNDWVAGTVKVVIEVILAVLTVLLLLTCFIMLHLYRVFSYDGEQQFSRKIIEHIAEYVNLPENGTGLDIGCGSGALTIACAKRNRQAKMVGLDRWGKEYASFNKALCESNAKIEGVGDNTDFVQGDAVKLDYPDETFDAVTSNYCYHNIPSRDRQKLILETLRVLKKGGTFAIHDEFIRSKYGDTSRLVNTLKEMGYEKVELLDTSDGLFMSRKEAKSLFLVGSGLLVGKK